MLDVSYTESAYTWHDAQHHRRMPSPLSSRCSSFFWAILVLSCSATALSSLKQPPSGSILALFRAKTTRLRVSWAHPHPYPARPVLCVFRGRDRSPDPDHDPLAGWGGDGVMQTPTSTNANTASRMETQNAPRSSSSSFSDTNSPDSSPRCLCRSSSNLMDDNASGVQLGLPSDQSPLHPSFAGRGPRSRRSLWPPPISAV